MPKVSAKVFKLLFSTVIILVVVQTCIYLYLVQTIDDKMNTIAYAITNECMSNNGLTSDAISVYNEIFTDFINKYGDAGSVNPLDGLVIAVVYNGTSPEGDVIGVEGANGNSVFATLADEEDTSQYTALNVRKRYGDRFTLKIKVYIQSIAWSFGSNLQEMGLDENGNITDIDKLAQLSYEFPIPCTRYIKE